MKPEIKKRITQVKKGEIPDGYRYTRAGICPNDWDIGILSDVLYNEQRAVIKPQKPYWRLGIRSHAKGTFHEYVENPETVDMGELYVVRENDLIVNITFAWEHAIALADKNDDGLLVSHRFPTYVFKEGQNPIFYKNIVVQKRFKELLALISPGGAGRNRVMSKKDFLKLACNIPPIAEQTKIAEILMQCDKVIELKQKLIDETKKLKKVLLRKMFPQKGENAPEIRFSGFTDTWEQRKLSEITSLITKGTTPLDKSNTGEINFIKVENLDSSSGEIISCSKITKAEHEGYLKRSQLKEDDILFSIAGTLGRVGIVKSGILPANTNQALSVIRLKEGNLGYISTVLRGRAVEDFIRCNPTIGAQPNLSLEQVGNLAIPYPKIDEQMVIGNFFRNLDSIITLHQRELEEWQNNKKALMQLLLTGIVRVNI